MDTNVDNYDIDDLYDIYKLTPETNIDKVYDKTITTIKRIRDSYEMEDTEKSELYIFFKECFYKICAIREMPIEDYMKKNLQINTRTQQEQEEQQQKQQQKQKQQQEQAVSVYNEKITNTKEYPGSLPEPISNTYTVNVNNDKYVRGTVNPLKRETVKNILTVSSKFRGNPNSTTTDFTIDLNNNYHNVVSLKLAGAELTNGYYPFSNHLNTNSFSIETYLLDATNNISNNYEKEIVIVEGIYNTTSLSNAINALLVADPKLNFVTSAYNYVKGKIFFFINPLPPVPAPPGYSYGFNLYFYVRSDPGRSLYLNMGWLIGYRKDVYIFLEDYVDTATITLEVGFNPESPAETTGTKFYMLEVNDYNNNSPEVFKYNLDSKTSFNVNNILAKIPNTAGSFSIIFEDSSDRIFKSRRYFGPVRINKLHIRLLDENGRVVDLNNSDSTFSFEIETLETPYKNMVYQ